MSQSQQIQIGIYSFGGWEGELAVEVFFKGDRGVVASTYLKKIEGTHRELFMLFTTQIKESLPVEYNTVEIAFSVPEGGYLGNPRFVIERPKLRIQRLVLMKSSSLPLIVDAAKDTAILAGVGVVGLGIVGMARKGLRWYSERRERASQEQVDARRSPEPFQPDLSSPEEIQQGWKDLFRLDEKGISDQEKIEIITRIRRQLIGYGNEDQRNAAMNQLIKLLRNPNENSEVLEAITGAVIVMGYGTPVIGKLEEIITSEETSEKAKEVAIDALAGLVRTRLSVTEPLQVGQFGQSALESLSRVVQGTQPKINQMAKEQLIKLSGHSNSKVKGPVQLVLRQLTESPPPQLRSEALIERAI